MDSGKQPEHSHRFSTKNDCRLETFKRAESARRADRDIFHLPEATTLELCPPFPRIDQS